MAQAFELSDPSDWLNTPLSSFASIDSGLRCQVCKDFYRSPMLTSCSHTFCSLCIRRCLATDGQCPTCRSSDQETKLRRNGTVAELVEAFEAARQAALEFARREIVTEEEGRTQRRGAKRKAEEAELDDEEVQSPGLTRRTRSHNRRTADEVPSAEKEVIEVEDDADQDYQPDDGLVACPICNKRMKEEAVYPHLDKCDGNTTSSVPKAKSIKGSQMIQLQAPQPTQKPTNSTPPARIPQLNHSLLKDRALRQKLVDLGIPDWGPRQLLIRRHKEWANLYNANCDSPRPRTKRELLRELDVWERTQGGSAPADDTGSGSAVMRREFDADGWARSHRDEFKELIAKARKPPPKHTASTVEDGEEQIAGKGGKTGDAPQTESEGKMNGVHREREELEVMDTDASLSPEHASQDEVVQERLKELDMPRGNGNAGLDMHISSSSALKVPVIDIPGDRVVDIDQHRR